MMRRVIGRSAALLMVGMFGMTAAAMAQGDPEAGQGKAALCAGCHGEKGISVSPEVPNLAGQKKAYLISALEAYQTDLRANPIMSSIAQGLSEQDIEDLAAYFSNL